VLVASGIGPDIPSGKPDGSDISHVLTGYRADLLTDLDALLPAGSVAVVEDPGVVATGHVRDRIGEVRCLAEVIDAPAHGEGDAERLAAAVPRPAGVRAVIPAGDHGVVAAAALAEAWGLPGAGVRAARLFCDKAVLRETAGAAGIPQPEWALVREPADVARFLENRDGVCVLKPTNRQAGVGVQILARGDDVAAAWAHTTGVHGRLSAASPAADPRYLAERRLVGPELSAEILVRDGEILFFNATGKKVLPGRHPVEMGHVVPAPPDGEVHGRLRAGMAALVEATGFSTGVLHGEWILVGGVPHLVECAARLPGDCIVELIGLAYGWSLLRGMVAVLEGRAPTLPGPAARGAAIRYLSAAPGRVRGIRGDGAARSRYGVREVLVRPAPGEDVEPVRSPWQRPGHVIATGADPEEAVRTAEQAAAAIAIDTGLP
jgi:biotin carboxylase